jgi:Uma2 family endonuclease
MATATSVQAEQAESDQCVVMYGVGWKGYMAILRAKGERRWPKMVYLDGDLYLMSPAYAHEWIAGRLGRLVMVVVEELDIPCIPTRSTTFRRRLRKGGAEADESFYLANVDRIMGRMDLHLRRDPPPDLVVEAVNTHDADESVEVWRRFGVPEVWVCDGKSLRILALQPDGRYAETPASPAFPFLSPIEILDWITQPHTVSETKWIKELRKWVAGTLAERYRQWQRDRDDKDKEAGR